jgi:hypothetical protein
VCTATLTTAHAAVYRSALFTNASHWCLILKRTTSVPFTIRRRRLRATSVALSLTCVCFSRLPVRPERCASQRLGSWQPLRRLRLWHLPPQFHAVTRYRAPMASCYTTVRSTLISLRPLAISRHLLTTHRPSAGLRASYLQHPVPRLSWHRSHGPG